LSLEGQLGVVESSDQMIEGTDPLLAFVEWCNAGYTEAARKPGELSERDRALVYVGSMVREFLFAKAEAGLARVAEEQTEHLLADPCFCGAPVGSVRCSCDDGDDERGI
jgi:hypothetical protein